MNATLSAMEMIVAEYEDRLAAMRQRIAELEAELAAYTDSNPSRPRGIRAGLIKGRIRNVDKPQVPNPLAPAFHEAVDAASIADLHWALNLLVGHPAAKRTFLTYRVGAIRKKLASLQEPL